MSTLVPWKKGYWTKVGNTLMPSFLADSLTVKNSISAPSTENSADVSYGANTGTGTSAPETVPSTENVSYGANSGSGGVGSGTTGTEPVTLSGDVNIDRNAGSGSETGSDVSYSANGGSTDGNAGGGENGATGTETGGGTEGGTTTPVLSPEMAPFDTDGDGILSYGEYAAYILAKNTQYWTDYVTRNTEALDKIKAGIYAQAAADKKKAEEEANIAHERAVVDAQNAATQNEAFYGAQAERLASMGLTGSGYGDYIAAQSYAQSRGEAQAAHGQRATAFRLAAENEADTKLAADLSYADNVLNVENTAAKGKLDADTSYAGNMQEYEKQQREKNEQDAIAAISAGILAGDYKTKDEAIAAAKAKGITDQNILDQIGSKWTAWDEGEKGEYNDNYANIEKMAMSGSYTADQIRAWCEKMNMNEADTNTLVGLVTQSKAKDTILENIENGDYATKEDALAAAAAEGITDQSILDEIGSIFEKTEKEKKDNEDAVYAEIYGYANSGEYSAEAIRRLCESAGMGEEATAEMVAIVQKNNELTYAPHFESGEYSANLIEEIEKELANGNLSEETVKKWRAQWVADYLDTEDPFLDKNSGRLSKKDATEEMNKIINSPWCTPELEAYLREKHTAIYKTEVQDLDAKTTKSSDGKLVIYLYYGGKQLSVTDPPKADGDVLIAAQDVADGSVFVHGSLTEDSCGVYYKHNGVVYSLDGDVSGGVANSDGSFKMSVLKGLLTGKYSFPKENQDSTTTENSSTVDLERMDEEEKEEYKLPEGNWTDAQKDLLWNLANSGQYELFAAMLPDVWSEDKKRRAYLDAGGK